MDLGDVMADHGHHREHSKDDSSGGTMDISDHIATWHAFWNGTKYSAIGLLVLAALLALFRTHNGY
jgi:Bacterial aa3 type cytochrome c oxidase subunit IV